MGRATGALSVARAAAGLRLGLLGLLGLAGAALRDFDESAGLPQAACAGAGAGGARALGVRGGAGEDALRALVVWDAVYFVRVCECGYEQERFFAFFPGLPLAMRALSRALALVLPLSPRASCSLAGLLISYAACIVGAVGLFRLGEVLLRDSGAARRAALLFCVNPASPFYSAAYTEASFAALSFWGLFFLSRAGSAGWGKAPRRVDPSRGRMAFVDEALAVVLFAAAAAVRSNGAVLCIFLAAHHLRAFVARPLGSVARSMLVLTIEAAFVLLPSAAFQRFGYIQLCGPEASTPRPWCTAEGLPSVYAFVQGEYWGVGLFRYWQMKQLPNFALAAPALILAALGTATFLRHVPLSACTGFWFLGRRSPARPPASLGLFAPEVAPFVFHWALLASAALLVMNVQVATRFLSACPALYWFADSLHGRARFWAHAFFLTYALAGSVAFANFYPWT